MEGITRNNRNWGWGSSPTSTKINNNNNTISTTTGYKGKLPERERNKSQTLSPQCDQLRGRNNKWNNLPFVTDPVMLTRRQKQIDYGKNTLEYENYLKTVAKDQRTPRQPQTPDITKKCSRRSWDGQVKIWRLLLHAYNPTGFHPKLGKKKEPVQQESELRDSHYYYYHR